MRGHLARRLETAMRAPRKASLRLRQLSFCAEVASDDLRALAWTRRFLHPFFRVATERPVWRITLLRDDDLCHEIGDLIAVSNAWELRPYVMHSHRKPVSEAASLGSLRLLRDREFETCCAASVEDREVLIVAERDSSVAPVALMRAVRELTCLDHQRRGGVIAHAAAFEAGGTVTIAAAPKFGGKTTFLIRALLDGARMVANDRVVLMPGPVGVRAVGMPTIMPVRDSTFDLFPSLQSQVAGRQLHFRPLSQSERRERTPSISPMQLASLTKAAVVTEGPLSRALFLTEGNGLPARLNADEAQGLLEESLFDFTDVEGLFFAGIFPLNGDVFRESSRRLCREACESAECLRYPRERPTSPSALPQEIPSVWVEPRATPRAQRSQASP